MKKPISLKAQLDDAKKLLSLPRLLHRIGDDQHAKPSALCPFHEDTNPSFSVFASKEGEYLWKCHAGCGSGDGVAYLEKRFALSTADAMRRYIKEAGVGRGNGNSSHPSSLKRAEDSGRGNANSRSKNFNWDACVEAFTPLAVDQLAQWRKLSVSFVEWLRRRKIVGRHRNNLAIAVHNAQGLVVSCHWLAEREKRRWAYYPTGRGTHPLVFGNTAEAATVLVFESQWDAFAVMDKFGWHENDGGLAGSVVVVTRGAENGKLVRGLCPSAASAYAFVQNDAPRDAGPTAAEKWLADVVEHIGCGVLRVETPLPHKDANDWTRSGATREQVQAAMRAAKLVPRLSPQEPTSPTEEDIKSRVRGEIIQVYTAEMSMAAKRIRISERVVSALQTLGSFYFHEQHRDFGSSMFFNAHRKRLDLISSDFFISWLSEWVSINRSDTLFRFIRSAVENAALSGKQTRGIVPEAFWAARKEAYYLSCGDGQIVKITAQGASTVDNGTDGVVFAAGKTMKPWKLIPGRNPFETCKVFQGVNSTAPHGKDLLMLWFYSFPTNPMSKPPLCLVGDIGSGKTRIARGIAELFGIPFLGTKVEDGGEKDFWTAINAGGLVTLDNVDTRTRWLPDALATASTGGSCQRRRLYTDAEILSMAPNAWIAITSAEPAFGDDAGLADRLLVVRMARRTGETSDAALAGEIMAARDAGLSHIAQTLAAALGDHEPTPASLNRRHPDFAEFGVKIGRALGREFEAVAALSAAEVDKSSFCIENNEIAAALVAYLREEGKFEGTAAELLPKLASFNDQFRNYSTKKLGNHLSKMWMHLEAILGSIEREMSRTGIIIYRLSAPSNAGFAGFEGAISQKS